MFYMKNYTVQNYKVLLNRLFSNESDILTPQQQVEIRKKILASGIDGHLFDNLIVKSKNNDEINEYTFPEKYDFFTNKWAKYEIIFFTFGPDSRVFNRLYYNIYYTRGCDIMDLFLIIEVSGDALQALLILLGE